MKLVDSNLGTQRDLIRKIINSHITFFRTFRLKNKLSLCLTALMVLSSIGSYGQGSVTLSFQYDNCIDTKQAGTYSVNGTYNGRPFYQKGSDSKIQWSGSRWELYSKNWQGNFYLTHASSSNTSRIPCDGWSGTYGCFAPSISGDCVSPPTSNTIPDLTVFEGAADETINLQNYFDDAQDGSAGLTYTKQSTDGDFFSSTINGSNQLVIDFDDSGTGESTVTIRATDSDGDYAEESFNVLVRAEVAGSVTIDFEGKGFVNGTSYGSNVYTEGNFKITYPTQNWDESSAGEGGSMGLQANGFEFAPTDITIEMVDGSEVDFIGFYSSSGLTNVKGYKNGVLAGTQTSGLSGSITLSDDFNDVDKVVLNSMWGYWPFTFDNFWYLPLAAGDTDPPVFENSTPSTSSVTASELTLGTDIDEAGTIYYVVLADGATAPTSAEVVAGKGSGGAASIDDGGQAVSSGAFTHDFSLSGLSSSTAYDIYVVAQDDEGTPNLQTSPTRVDVTTISAGSSISGELTTNDDIATDNVGDFYYDFFILSNPTASPIVVPDLSIIAGSNLQPWVGIWSTNPFPSANWNTSGAYSSALEIKSGANGATVVMSSFTIPANTDYYLAVATNDYVSNGPNLDAYNCSTSADITFIGDDETAPTFDVSPSASNVNEAGFTLSASIDEAGTIYYVVLSDGAAAPSSSEVVSGTGSGGASVVTSGNAEVSTGSYSNDFAVSGLSAETSYDIYVVANDDVSSDEGVPNLMASPTLVNVTTTTPPCTDPTGPTLAASSSTICPSGSVTITITGNLNDATAWHIYTGSCGGTSVGSTSGTTYVVSPSSTTTYYIRGEGGCVTPGSCQTITITVEDTTDPVTPVLADITGECSATATAPTTTDACAGTITGTTTDPLTYDAQGSYVIEWTFDDGNGNSIKVDQNVIIDDVTDPVIPTLADITGECSATATAPTTTDACAGTITGTTTDSLTYTTQGTHVIEWTFDDGNGNSITVEQNVIIDDVTDPVIPTLADITGECSATATAPTTTDACAGTITGTTTDSLTYTTQGTHVIEWTFDDGNGNSITVEQNVIIDDVTDPVIPTLADITGECSATATAPTTTDACAGTITGTTTDPLTYDAQGSYVIEWTFDDGNGNSIKVEQNVIIDDVTDPVTPTLADITGECSATATTPTTTDACAGTITGITSDSLTYTTQGTHVIEWTFDDGNGNSIKVDQNVIIDDVTDPITPALADITGECSATATAPTTTDACAGTITGTTTDPLTYDAQGSYVIEWTFDDGNGNSITVDQNVIIDDVTDPVIPTLADITGECSATATAPTTTDACAGTITGTTTDSLTYTTQGTHVIEWTFDDGNGNSITVDQNVIIDDVTDPIIPTLADITGECSATATTPTTTDACAGTITGITSDSLTYTTQGTHVIEWTFDDGNGNSIKVDQNVIIDDVTDPITPALADIIGECSATATAPTTTDACAGTITGTTTDPLTYDTQGSYVIEWTFDDGNGNSITVDQNVIIDDVTDPVIPTLADITGECSATATAPTTTDACAGTITGTTTDSLTYTTQGTHVIEWTFDDGNGNSITVDQNVIIDDVTDPIVPTLADITGECSATATAPTTTDACAGTITGTTTDSLTYTTQGTHVIEWTFDDGNGNSITVDQNVIIDDVTDPIIPTLADITGECSATATTPTTTDACAGTITGTTSDPLTYDAQGSYVIEWTFDDGNGNSIKVDQNVIIDDVTDPITPALADITGECSATATAPTTTDACAGTITGTTTDPLTYDAQGSYVIEWTFDDGNGNSITVDQNVIIDDVTDPVIPTLADVRGECSATATAPTTTDACAGTITGTTTDPLTYDAQGSYVITWIFDDGNGNSITVDQNVIIDDVTNPEMPSLADLTGECAATVSAPRTRDACAGTITGTTTDPLTYNRQGTYVITWTFDDGNGNSITVDQDVVIDDVTDPVIIGNSIQEVVVGRNSSYTVSGTEFDPIEASDNCGVARVTNDFNNSSTLANAAFPVGNTTVVWTVEDIAGNTGTYSSDITVGLSVGIDAFQEKGISLYPNPTNGMIHVEFANNKIQRLTISDMLGRRIVEKSSVMQNEEVDLSGFDDGVYIISILIDNKIYRTKVVKK